MQYEKKIQEIFARHPSVQVSGFSGRSYKAGIDSMLAFDAVLGRPWKSYRCIHVAGTNGKGSVSSMLAASLAASGLRVGLYTSPHLLDFRERIKVVGESHCPGKPCRPRRGRGGTVNEVNGGVERKRDGCRGRRPSASDDPHSSGIESVSKIGGTKPGRVLRPPASPEKARRVTIEPSGASQTMTPSILPSLKMPESSGSESISAMSRFAASTTSG